jgi:Asp-tRNA(Asn)/Glu-tRNA(Gln) amidotransferase A subunit family amidase
MSDERPETCTICGAPFVWCTCKPKITIQQMLDTLADYQAQKDLLELSKTEMLNEVKVPAEVLAAQAEANKQRQAVDSALYAAQQEINAQCRAVVADLVEPALPPEYIEAMAAYHAQVEDANSQASFRTEQERKRSAEMKAKIDADLTAKVKDVYAQVEQRKSDIEYEFTDKAKSVIDNISSLTAEIKAETIKAGSSQKGKFWQAVYVRGRVTWNTDMLDGMCIAYPELTKARKVGEPSVTLRKV